MSLPAACCSIKRSTERESKRRTIERQKINELSLTKQYIDSQRMEVKTNREVTTFCSADQTSRSSVCCGLFLSLTSDEISLIETKTTGDRKRDREDRKKNYCGYKVLDPIKNRKSWSTSCYLLTIKASWGKTVNERQYLDKSRTFDSIFLIINPVNSLQTTGNERTFCSPSVPFPVFYVHSQDVIPRGL